jgi:hypothetical protein
MGNEGFEGSFFGIHVNFVVDYIGFTIIGEKFQGDIWVLK